MRPLPRAERHRGHPIRLLRSLLPVPPLSPGIGGPRRGAVAGRPAGRTRDSLWALRCRIVRPEVCGRGRLSPVRECLQSWVPGPLPLLFRPARARRRKPGSVSASGGRPEDLRKTPQQIESASSMCMASSIGGRFRVGSLLKNRDESGCKPGSVLPGQRRPSILDRCCQRPHATYPGTRASSPRTSPVWSCSGWGLPSHPSHLGCWWSLAPPFHPYLRTQAVCFLWHCPAGHPGWVLPTTLLCGARTFLSLAGRDRPPDSSDQPVYRTGPARHPPSGNAPATRLTAPAAGR